MLRVTGQTLPHPHNAFKPFTQTRQPRFRRGCPALLKPWGGLGVALVEPWWSLGGALVEPWWSLGGALVEPWGSLGVALGWPWGGFGVALGCLCGAYQQALGWPWGGFGWLCAALFLISAFSFVEVGTPVARCPRSEEHTSELQSRQY